MPDIQIDARDLEPPEPLERALAAVALLRPGQRVRLLLHREPFPLYPILDDMGCVHHTEPLPGGEFLIHIEAPAGTPAT